MCTTWTCWIHLLTAMRKLHTRNTPLSSLHLFSEPDPIPPQSPVFTISIVKVSNAFEGIQDKLHMLLLQPIWSSQQELLQNSVLDAILHIETDLTFIPFLCHDRVIQTLARMSLFIHTFQGLPKYLICDCHCPNKMPRGMYPGHLHWRCSFRYAQLQWQRLPSNRHFKHGRALWWTTIGNDPEWYPKQFCGHTDVFSRGRLARVTWF